MTRATRETLGLEGRVWSSFDRCGANPLPLARASGRVDLESEPVEKLRLVLSARHQANPQGVPDRMLRQVIDRHGETSYAAAHSPWSRGDAWQRWTHLLCRYLRQEQPDPYRLHAVVDCMLHHFEQDLPWPAARHWEDYYRRSQRWHEELYRRRSREREEELRATDWDSLIPELAAGGLTAQAVTNGYRLHRLGEHLHNCLGVFVPRCAAGRSRIFVINTPGGEIAAVAELRKEQGEAWRVGQVERRGNYRPSAAERYLARRLCQEYNRAEQAQRAEAPEPAGAR